MPYAGNKGYQLFENPRYEGVNYGEWKVIPTIRHTVREDVDYAVNRAMTFKQFVSLMEKMGYRFKFNKHIAVLPPHGKKYIRLKSLSNDDSYTEESIRIRSLEISNMQFESVQEEKHHPKVLHYKGSMKTAKKITGLRALYFRYMYAMGILPKNAPNKKRVHSL